MTVSEATARKYGWAYAQLCEGVDESFFPALAAAHAADESGDGLIERADRIESLIESQKPDTTTLFLGIHGSRQQPLTATALRIDDGPASALIGPDEERQFRAVCRGLADRHPALSVVPVSGATHAELLPRSPTGSLGQTWDGLTPIAFDPLVGVHNLSGAVARAAALGASGDDTIPTGWAILAANLAGRRESLTPIRAWARLFRPLLYIRESDAPLAKLMESSGDDLKSVMPDYQRISDASQRYLRRWLDAYTVAFWQVQIDTTTGGLQATEDHGTQLNAADGSQVLLYDDHQFPQLPKILAQRGFAAASLSAGGLDLPSSSALPTTYRWFPCIGISEKFALLRNPDGRWLAAQMFARHNT